MGCLGTYWKSGEGTGGTEWGVQAADGTEWGVQTADGTAHQ